MILTDQARSKKEINNKSYSSSQTISPSGLREVAGLTRLLSPGIYIQEDDGDDGDGVGDDDLRVENISC